jgi:hypothetical protein
MLDCKRNERPAVRRCTSRHRARHYFELHFVQSGDLTAVAEDVLSSATHGYTKRITGDNGDTALHGSESLGTTAACTMRYLVLRRVGQQLL